MDHDNPTLWPIGTPLRIVKLAVCEDPQYQTCSWKDWKIGAENDGSPPVDYELRGFLIEALEVGMPIVVARTHRNDVEEYRIFISTPVREFKNGAAITMNSIYFISRLEGDSEERSCL